jgi:uncharacterized glyoxalase superfamily protein PhnB
MKKLILAAIGFALLSGFTPARRKSNMEAKMVHVKKITPVLCVEEIEPSLKFWTERFGFKNAGEVPDGNKLGFVMLQKDGVELMYQSYASAAKDNPAMAQLARKGPTFLYIEVEKLDPIMDAIKGAEVAVPLRTTFYGPKEIGVKDPAGHVILFAEFTKPAQQ